MELLTRQHTINGCPQRDVLTTVILHPAYSAFAIFQGKTI
jgi:hypothetical protein